MSIVISVIRRQAATRLHPSFLPLINTENQIFVQPIRKTKKRITALFQIPLPQMEMPVRPVLVVRAVAIPTPNHGAGRARPIRNAACFQSRRPISFARGSFKTCRLVTNSRRRSYAPLRFLNWHLVGLGVTHCYTVIRWLISFLASLPLWGAEETPKPADESDNTSSQQLVYKCPAANRAAYDWPVEPCR